MKWTYSILILLLSTISCSTSKSFKIAVLPDTQTYTRNYPDIFHSQTQWIVDHKKEISFVLHLGDITSNNIESQWEIASAAMSRLDGKVPYVMTLGNHDIGPRNKAAWTRDSRLFNTYFPYEKYSKSKHFGGAFEIGKMDNVWYTFRTGSVEWLVLALEFGPRDEVLKWAERVIQSNPNKKVIVNTHAYLYSDNVRMKEGYRWIPQSYGIGKNSGEGAVNHGQQMWEKLICKYPNIVFVFCGHVLNDGTGLLISKGNNGNNVCQMLSNYQQGVRGSENGGNGFLRIVEVNMKTNVVSVKTYSPYTNTFKTEPDQQFIIENLNLN